MTSSGKRNAHARSRENRMKERERSLSASLRFGDLVVVDVDDGVARDSMVCRVFLRRREEKRRCALKLCRIRWSMWINKNAGRRVGERRKMCVFQIRTRTRVYILLSTRYVSRIVTLYALLFYMVRLKHLSSLVVQILRLDIHVFQSLLRVHVRRVRVD